MFQGAPSTSQGAPRVDGGGVPSSPGSARATSVDIVYVSASRNTGPHRTTITHPDRVTGSPVNGDSADSHHPEAVPVRLTSRCDVTRSPGMTSRITAE